MKCLHILLLSDIPPCTNYTAGLVEKVLCEFLLEEGHQVSFVGIISDDLQPKIPVAVKQKMELFLFYRKPKESYGRRKIFGTLQSRLVNGYHSRYSIPRLARVISRDILNASAGIDMIWAGIQGQTMIEIVPLVANYLHLPYVTEVWDPPEWWFRDNEFDVHSFAKGMSSFRILMSGCRCCLAASFEMAAEYNRQYGCKCVPVMPSLPAVDILPIHGRNKKVFNIVFCGQIYAANEMVNFIKSLDALGWHYNGMTIKLCIFSAGIWGSHGEFIKKHVNVKYYSWIDQQELLLKLTKMDLCYCPYRFSKEFEIIARLSFPAKLTSYLRSGVPVFIHAPAYASISKFLEDGISGYICNTEEIDGIIACLKKVMDDGARNVVGENGYKKFLQFLTHEAMKKSFFDSLGIGV